MVRSGIFERQSDNLSAIHVLDELKDVEANSAVLPGIRGEDHTKCGPRTRILELVELVRSDLLEELEMKGLRMKLENRG